MRATVFCLLLAACGHPGAPPEVRIGVPSGSLSSLQIHLADFEREGLRVRVEELASAGKVMEALLGGSVDAGSTTYEQVAGAAALGRDQMSFFVLATRYSQVLAAPGRGEIKSVADLKGRAVGVASFGDATQNTLNLMLRRQGLRPDAVTPVAIGIGASAVAALENGRVDAAVLLSATLEVARERHPDISVLFDSRTAEGSRGLFGEENVPSAAVSASSRWLAANGDTARRLTRALARAGRWMQEHPIEEVEGRVPASLRPSEAAVFSRTLRLLLPTLSSTGRMPVKGAKAIRDYLGLSVDAARTFTDEYLEPAP